MAIYHLSTTLVSRSSGRSSTAAAAYRAGVELTDSRTGQVHDYRRRRGVVSAHLVFPRGASGTTREALWNAAEAAERRKDGRTAREWVIALPGELTDAQRQALALQFAGVLAGRYGVAADVAIHVPDRGGDQRNHHAHVLSTTRVYGADGTLGVKSAIEWSDGDRRKAGMSSAADEIRELREAWAALANAALQEAGQTSRIDSRSLREQRAAALRAANAELAEELDRTPTVHLGPTVTQAVRASRAGQGAEALPRRARLQGRIRGANQEAARIRGEMRDVAAELAALEREGDMAKSLVELQRELAELDLRPAIQRVWDAAEVEFLGREADAAMRARKEAEDRLDASAWELAKCRDYVKANPDDEYEKKRLESLESVFRIRDSQHDRAVLAAIIAHNRLDMAIIARTGPANKALAEALQRRTALEREISKLGAAEQNRKMMVDAVQYTEVALRCLRAGMLEPADDLRAMLGRYAASGGKQRDRQQLLLQEMQSDPHMVGIVRTMLRPHESVLVSALAELKRAKPSGDSDPERPRVRR